MGKGATGERFNNPAHIYADDLDVFGRGSLFELLSTARTAAGEEALASWLLAPADRQTVLNRQEAVSELSPQLDFREDLALLGEDIQAEVNSVSLANWGSAPPVEFSPLLRISAPVLAVAGIATLIGFFAHVLPIFPFAAVLACNFLILYRIRKRVSHVGGAVETPAQHLLLLSLILERLEREQFQSPLLKKIRSDLEVSGLPASKRIARLKRWIELLDSGDHMLLRVLRPIVMWQEQAAMAVEAWRRESGPKIGRWITAVAEFEALSSLSTLAFYRPDWPFPVLAGQQDACFDAQSLRHPLLPAAKCVPNNVAAGAEIRLLIVSGSNMSGKSTLLRAVGLNAILAWAGAPVAAASLRISPLQVAASMRVVDSLQDNRSRFFTEITRIRQIVTLAETGSPVLFLLDELLSGTNSHDRVIGAAGIARALVQFGAIGLITTHDLALAKMEQDLGPIVRNVHFEDQITNGEIHFDYKLKPGVVTRSNALALMRVIGLNV
jgi:DNA mismatch repair ATPase MutS